MKTVKSILVLVGFVLTTLSFNSCLSDDDGYSLDKVWLTIATARPQSSDSFYLTLDDSTTLWPASPVNIDYQPTKPQRVQMNYTILGDNFQGYDHAIKINRIDTILTKAIAPNLGVQNDSIYGKDPVEITALWVGDGFLNVEFRTHYSGNIKHFINLIHKDSVSVSPFTLEFRHNAYGDNLSAGKQYGLVAFDLSSLPPTNKETKLYIDVTTFEGSKTYELKYLSGAPGKEPTLSASNTKYIH